MNYFILNDSIECLKNSFEMKNFLNWFFIEYIDDKNYEKTNKNIFFWNDISRTLNLISRTTIL